MRRIIESVLTTGVATAISMMINLFLTPFITDKLGVDAYGFISLSNTFVGYAAILTTALDSFATRFIAVEYHKGNLRKASRYYSSLIVANFAISMLLLVVALPLYVSPGSFLNVPEGMGGDVGYLFLLTFINFSLTTMSTALSVSVYIKNRLDLYGIAQVIANVVEAGLILFLYWIIPPSLSLFGIALVASSLTLVLANLRLHKKLIPELEFDVGLFSFSSLKDLAAAGVWSSINTLGNLLNSGVGLFIANLMLSATSMGQLAISKTFSSVLTRLYQLVSQAFYPKILKHYSENRRDELLDSLTVASSITGSFAAILFAGFFALCPAFYRLWVPNQPLDILYPLTMLTMFYSFAEGALQPLYYVYALTLKNRFPSVLTVIGGFVNIAIACGLIKFTNLGVFSIPIASGLVMAFISFVCNPIYMAKCLEMPWHYLYPTLIRVTVACVVCCLVFGAVGQSFSPKTWIEFVLAVLLDLFIGVILCAIVFCKIINQYRFSRARDVSR